jgi:hypothetical protein
MKKAKRRETAHERDLRIVREAGPWRFNYQGCLVWADNIGMVIGEDPRAALVRIANRLSKGSGR